MSRPRVIARVEIKGPNVIKGIAFEGLRIIGDPVEICLKYAENGADELLLLDTVASLYGRNNLLNVVEKVATKIGIPLTVAGGISSIRTARAALESGADKVCLNTAAVQNPELITVLANAFGSQCIVIAIDYKKWPDSRFLGATEGVTVTGQTKLKNSFLHEAGDSFQVYSEHGRQQTGLDALTWSKQVSLLGAGELLLTSIDHDGRMGGFHKSLAKQLTTQLRIPVILCGGASTASEIEEIFEEKTADAVAIGSALHYGRINWHDINNQSIKRHRCC